MSPELIEFLNLNFALNIFKCFSIYFHLLFLIITKEKEILKPRSFVKEKKDKREIPAPEFDLHIEKLVPNKRGMSNYDILTLQAETFAVGSAALPKLEEAAGREATLARIEQIRHMTDTLDLLYAAFLQDRLGQGWGDNVGEIRQWLKAA